MRFTTEYGFYELNPFPGSNQIVVKNHAFVNVKGQGHGSKQHFQSNEKAEELGYDYMLCTVREDNLAQINILKAHCWNFFDSFKSTETEHVVQIWGRKT
jgi:hypothetical protein